jgi:ubiquitin-conjugating enzyme E2 J1
MPAWGVRTALVALRSFMETDPKGQLGGMECSKEERARIAKQSTSWKCSVCGRSNNEIMQEAEEAASANEQKDGASIVEEVPKELSLGWKDEMGKEKKNEETSEDLAEGFVQTTSNIPEPPAGTSSTTYPAARPAQSVPQPTGIPIIQSHQVNLQNIARTQVAHRSNDMTIVWIDRTIAAVVVCLVALILKVLLGV